MSFILAATFWALMIGAAFSDLLTMRIPNWLVLVVAAIFFPAAVLLQMPLPDIGFSLLCALAVLVVTFGLFAFNIIGGGDAKLAAAIALWMGPAQILPYLVYASVLGGFLTILVLIYRSAPIEVWTLKYEWLSRLKDRRKGVPYGIALALAAIIVYPSTKLALLAA